MSTISIQFHVLPQELMSWLMEWTKTHNLHVVLLEHGPYKATPLSLEELCMLDIDDRTRRFSLTLGEPNLGADNSGAFSDLNPNRLTVDVGGLSDSGLRESWFTTRACDPVAIHVWKSLVADLKRRTKAGAIAVHPVSGATSCLRNHRYSVGAFNIASTGTPILPAAGVTKLHLGKRQEMNPPANQ